MLRPDHPLAGAGAPPRRRSTGSTRTGSCPGSTRTDRRHRRPRRPAAGRRRAVPAGPGDPRRPRHRLGRGAQPARWPPQLLAAADLWLFVTSAARYADQVPWDFLRQAAERSTAVAIVLDRTAAARPSHEVAAHLARMLRQPRPAGLAAVHRHRGRRSRATACCPPPHVARDPGLAGRRWPPTPTPGPPSCKQTLDGAIRSLARRTHDVADAAAEQVDDRRAGCAQDVDARLRPRRSRRVDEASADGTLLRGEVLARWQEFVGTGELLRSLETEVGWLRDRVVGAVQGQAAAGRAGHRRGRVRPGDADPRARRGRRRAGRGVLAVGGRRPGTCSRTPARTSAGPRATSGAAPSARSATGSTGVLEMVRTEGADKRSTARFLAFGVNGLSVALMVVVFASHRPALTGAEVGIAGGSARARPEAARGGLRRPGRPPARRPGPRGPATRGSPALLDAERARYLDRARRPRRSTAGRRRAAARRVPPGRRPAVRRPAAAAGRTARPAR